MNEIRVLNDAGISKFTAYILSLADDATLEPPKEILLDDAWSEKAKFTAQIEPRPYGRPFSSAYELGNYLCTSVLVSLPKSDISHDYRLWNWLALYLFDELCPSIEGNRKPLELSAYVLAKEYSYQRYYRHIVRSAWALVTVHGDRSKVLLVPGTKHPVPVAVRAEPQMQISATQQFVESKNVVRLAYELYFDEKTDKLKAGSSTKEDGGPRRFVSVLNQFDLTYDLEDPPTDTLLQLLPEEFTRFKNPSKLKKPKKKIGGSSR
ncbi:MULTISPECIES: hypothetical protein [unclassified Polaromonas]|jgi:hypothetical protein|uniref:hypothetical protein n=1 Tax=unclassified Polaromonas TaxID=2638319 RepID=UPI0025DFAFE0|nr:MULTISPECIES: hypothetical protein [unclassified Polaromonas]HQR97422.1 hypothetical protein [Polaromonas sp.]HQS41496.1 hypothetical protein [Polaromonas sp.]HQS88468.1 hypothetical protein [Polaromonas sp.]HQT07811.1 hypothetical protein [Polaromonas sp.]